MVVVGENLEEGFPSVVVDEWITEGSTCLLAHPEGKRMQAFVQGLWKARSWMEASVRQWLAKMKVAGRPARGWPIIGSWGTRKASAR